MIKIAAWIKLSNLMVRDEEFRRLVLYAKGLGLEVIVKPLPKTYGHHAEWVTDGSAIILYKSSSINKTDLLLNLIHELAHHLDFVYRNRKENPKLIEALIASNNVDSLTKEQRKLIYQTELDAIPYRELIYKETNMKFSLQKLLIHIEFDKWIYNYFYENGDFPYLYESKQKLKQLREKYARKKV